MKKKLILLLSFFNIFLNPVLAVKNANTQQASSSKPLVLQGSVVLGDEKTKKIELQPESLINSEINIEGDFFSAYISEADCEKLKVPFYSRLIGYISDIQDPQSFKRDAKMQIMITDLLLPDGDKFKVHALLEANLEELSVKTTAKEVIKNTSQVTASTLVGASDALEYLGLPLAVASHGITVGVGAGLGLGLGLYGLAKEHGEAKVTSGFQAKPFKLKDDFIFIEKPPIFAENLKAFSPDIFGVDLIIKDIQKHFSVDYGDFIEIDLALQNKSPYHLYSSDFVLASKKHIIPVLNNFLFSDFNNLTKKITASKKDNLRLAFSLAKINKNEDYTLKLIDPLTQKTLVDFGIDIKNYL